MALRAFTQWLAGQPGFRSKLTYADANYFRSSAAPIRRIFKEAFTSARLPYVNPHSFRNTLASLGERLCASAEHFKAWSQNIGHDKVLTTLTSYGKVTESRQAEIFEGLREGAVKDAESRGVILDAETATQL